MVVAVQSSVLLIQTFCAEQFLANNANTGGDSDGMIRTGILVFSIQRPALRTIIRVKIDLAAAIVALIHRCRLRKRSDEQYIAIGAKDRFVSVFSFTIRAEFHFIFSVAATY